ncbi:MAG TPA: S24 family peptidase [Burkholderiales bacterium]|nr:S24 family peptidase [Burkholderiales bacterium]
MMASALINKKMLDPVSENRKNNLKKLIEKYYKSVNDFCVQHNLDYSAVHRYISGGMRVGSVAVKRFERIFNLKSGDFDKDSISILNEIVEFPVYTSMGNYTSVENLLNREPDGYKNINRDDFSDFQLEENKIIGLVCDNESMIPDIRPGWNILIDLTDTEISEGETYALLMNNKIMFRNVFFASESGYLVLKPSNIKFDDKTVKEDDITIIGKPAYILGQFKK